MTACDGAPVAPSPRLGRLRAVCACGQSIEVADQGLGRAVLAAFRSRHQEDR